LHHSRCTATGLQPVAAHPDHADDGPSERRCHLVEFDSAVALIRALRTDDLSSWLVIRALANLGLSATDRARLQELLPAQLAGLLDGPPSYEQTPQPSSAARSPSAGASPARTADRVAEPAKARAYLAILNPRTVGANGGTILDAVLADVDRDASLVNSGALVQGLLAVAEPAGRTREVIGRLVALAGREQLADAGRLAGSLAAADPADLVAAFTGQLTDAPANLRLDLAQLFDATVLARTASIQAVPAPPTPLAPAPDAPGRARPMPAPPVAARPMPTSLNGVRPDPAPGNGQSGVIRRVRDRLRKAGG
jgi:hypothetical protein